MCQRLSQRLKELRINAGLRQQDVAEMLNVARVTYSNYERGTREPGKEILSQLARIYHVSIAYLTGETEIPFPYQNYSEKERYIFDHLPHVNEPTLNYLVSVVEFSCSGPPSPGTARRSADPDDPAAD